MSSAHALDMRLIRHYDTLVSRGHIVQHRSRMEENDEESRGSRGGHAAVHPFLSVLPCSTEREASEDLIERRSQTDTPHKGSLIRDTEESLEGVEEDW